MICFLKIYGQVVYVYSKNNMGSVNDILLNPSKIYIEGNNIYIDIKKQKISNIKSDSVALIYNLLIKDSTLFRFVNYSNNKITNEIYFSNGYQKYICLSLKYNSLKYLGYSKYYKNTIHQFVTHNPRIYLYYYYDYNGSIKQIKLDTGFDSFILFPTSLKE